MGGEGCLIVQGAAAAGGAQAVLWCLPGSVPPASLPTHGELKHWLDRSTRSLVSVPPDALQETPFTQGGAEAVAAMRIKAMELTDLGMRVEDALSYTMGLRRIMRAAAALESLGD